MKCFACGEQIRDEAHFCPYCGKDQSERPAPKLCLHCGQPLVPGAKFCGCCGGDQSMQPETESVEVPVVAEEPVAAQESEVAEEPVVMEQIVPAEPETEPVLETDPVVAETPEEPAEEPAAEEPAVAPSVEQPAPAPVIVPPVAEPIPVPAREPAPYRYDPDPAYQPQPAVTPVAPPAVRPALQLPTGRGMLKYFLLGLITFMIYPLVIMSRISGEINIVASRHDGKRTMHFLGMTLLAPLTLMIYVFVWYHKLCGRMGDELVRRKIRYKFSAASYWLWNLVWPLSFSVAGTVGVFVLQSMRIAVEFLPLIGIAAGLIGSVGMFVFFHKFFKSMNLINADYNEKG